MKLNPQQNAMILAALHHWQHDTVDWPFDIPDEIVDIAIDGGSFDALSRTEIDELCELIYNNGLLIDTRNTDTMPSTPAAASTTRKRTVREGESAE